ncbi:MAG: hypothetical protein CMM07_17840 [Rhodopirellula sp.]|nr:hypothetical protein [Rhodopirellula sp.]HCA35403.1 hypothetical protein [Gammaproteobacteria bacterium]
MTTERPILLKDEMVRAILDGRKTQTRRIANNVYFDSKYRAKWKAVRKHTEVSIDTPAAMLGEVCPYGQPGDRLWVRETHHVPGGYLEADLIDEIRNGVSSPESLGVTYRADAPSLKPCDGGWTPSIHMPRWASRITLEITNVRVERLKDLSEGDAEKEGCAPAFLDEFGNVGGVPFYRRGFCKLWREIKGHDSWEANPWVWVIEFKRIPQEANQ